MLQDRSCRAAVVATVAALLSGGAAYGESEFMLDFEGLGVWQSAEPWGIPHEGYIEQVADFYNGGTGGSGSGPGPDFGVEFSSNALALRSEGANFGGEPSPDTVLFFLTGDAATMTRRDGFTDGFSFYYSAVNQPGSIDVYSGPDGTGDVLASLELPTTPTGGNPEKAFDPFVAIGVEFDGVAQSVDFGGAINQIGFDNITFGASEPDSGFTDPGDDSIIIPTPTAAAGGLMLFAGLAVRRFWKQRDVA